MQEGTLSTPNIGLFGTATRSRVLLTMHMLGESHAAELARILEISLSQAQNAIGSLERTGVVAATRQGIERRVRLDEGYVHHSELKALLEKMAASDVELQQRLAAFARRRGRKSAAA